MTQKEREAKQKELNNRINKAKNQKVAAWLKNICYVVEKNMLAENANTCE
jgi:hypothetical protein